MTQHPATVGTPPARPVRPWVDAGAIRAELEDLRVMLNEAGRTGPLRDEVANLIIEAEGVA